MADLKPRKKFGWLPDIPDHRDLKYGATTVPDVLPPVIDLTTRADWPPCYDQGELGSCVANATAAALQYEQIKRATAGGKFAGSLGKRLIFMPSRLFIYYGAREIEGTTASDDGCMIRDAIKVVYNVGGPRETGWKYDISKFAKKPNKTAYNSAAYDKITTYKSVPVDVNEVRKAIAEDLPVIVGIAVFNSFMFATNGDISMPGPQDYMEGGHAILLVGYDDEHKYFKFRNSWGPEWGNNGYGRIPYAYIGNPDLADDFWVLTDSEYKERM